MSKKADIVIITYNCRDFTLKCIQSLYQYNSQEINDIIIVDNNSNDDSIEIISNLFPKIKIIKNPENFGYAKAVNIGMDNAKTDIVIVSNADVEYSHNSVRNLLNTFEIDSKIAVTGPQQFYPNGKNQYSWGYTPSLKNVLIQLFSLSVFSYLIYDKIYRNQEKIIDVSYADGAVLAIRKSIFDSLNGFDEVYFFYTEEADFCYRAKKSGYRVVNNTAAKVTHYRGASTTLSGPNEKSVAMMFDTVYLFCQKHLSQFQTKYYFRLLLLNYKKIKLIYNFLSKFKSDAVFQSKIININLYINILKKLIKKNGL